MPLWSGPLQKKHFGAEARTERRQKTPVAGFDFSARHPLMEHEQHRSTRKIALFPQHIPGRLHLASTQPELLLHIAEQFLASGMKHEGADLFLGELVSGKEPLEQSADVFTDELRHFLGEHDVKAG